MKINNHCAYICIAPGKPKLATCCERR
jgi:hypothetical protein